MFMPHDGIQISSSWLGLLPGIPTAVNCPAKNISWCSIHKYEAHYMELMTLTSRYRFIEIFMYARLRPVCLTCTNITVIYFDLQPAVFITTRRGQGQTLPDIFRVLGDLHSNISLTANLKFPGSPSSRNSLPTSADAGNRRWWRSNRKLSYLTLHKRGRRMFVLSPPNKVTPKHS